MSELDDTISVARSNQKEQSIKIVKELEVGE